MPKPQGKKKRPTSKPSVPASEEAFQAALLNEIEDLNVAASTANDLLNRIAKALEQLNELKRK